jgi:hypothetical protein
LLGAGHSLQSAIQSERASLDQQRQGLDQDRRNLAAARVREPLIAEAIGAATTLLVVVALVVLCIYLIRAASSSSTEPDLNEFLLTELVADEPSLLPAPPPVSDQLPAPADERQS